MPPVYVSLPAVEGVTVDVFSAVHVPATKTAVPAPAIVVAVELPCRLAIPPINVSAVLAIVM